MGGENKTTHQKRELSLEALLHEKQDLLNLTCFASKDGFVQRLRKLLFLEKRLSQTKKSKKD